MLKAAHRLLRLDFGGDRDVKIMFMMRGVVLSEGDWLVPHRHDSSDGAHYSGVWYLDAGDAAATERCVGGRTDEAACTVKERGRPRNTTPSSPVAQQPSRETHCLFPAHLNPPPPSRPQRHAGLPVARRQWAEALARDARV